MLGILIYNAKIVWMINFLKKYGGSLLMSCNINITNNAQLVDLMNLIFDNLSDGIYITDSNAVTVYVNDTYEEISGIPTKEIIGKHIQYLIDKGYIDRSGTLIALKTNKKVSFEQKYMQNKKAQITSIPIANKNNEVVLIVSIIKKLDNDNVKQNNSNQNTSSFSKSLNSEEYMSEGFVAKDSKMMDLVNQSLKISELDTTVLIMGETGVGKDEIARFIVKNSTRANKPFLSINCAAIPAALIESELFGYQKGAFTGAEKEGKIGVFQSASGGTLILEEIGELPLEIQVKLLRVLQEMKIKPIGATQEVDIDVRIIATTNRDLLKMIGENSFREDLYYRISTFSMTVPPLRERVGDIKPLINYYLRNLNQKYNKNKEFDDDSMMELLCHNWPGNIRELKNVIENAVILSPSDVIEKEVLSIFNGLKINDAQLRGNVNLKNAVIQFEYEHINAAYEKYGNVREAARSLNIDIATLVRKRQKYENMVNK